MTSLMRLTVLTLAGALVGISGCRHCSHLVRPGNESCPSESYPSDDHPAPPQPYYHGPLTPKAPLPGAAAPEAPAQTPRIEELPAVGPELQGPVQQDGTAPPEDDPTASLRTAHEQLLAGRNAGTVYLRYGKVQPVQLQQIVESDPDPENLAEFETLPTVPPLQAPPGEFVPPQPGVGPVCGVAHSPAVLPQDVAERTTLLQKLRQQHSKKATETTAVPPPAVR